MILIQGTSERSRPVGWKYFHCLCETLPTGHVSLDNPSVGRGQSTMGVWKEFETLEMS